MNSWSWQVVGSKWLTAAIITLIPWITACADRMQPLKPPLSLPFEVKAGSKVETKLQIEDNREYIFSLRFDYKKDDLEDRARVKKLVGDDGQRKDGDPGISTPLKLQIYYIDAAGEKLIHERDIPVLRLRSWGAGHFSKHIAYINLKPGNYQVSVESLRDAPELAGTPIALSIGFYAKSTPVQ
jgi:hypothetical protein